MVNKRLLEVEFRVHHDNFRHGCHRAGTEIQGKINHFKVWEKSENFTSSQGKITPLKEVREKKNFK